MTAARTQDVIVVGGGIAGLSTAFVLAQKGASVTVLESAATAMVEGAATWASGGMLCARLEMGRATPAMVDLALRSHDAWPNFARSVEAVSGQSCGLVQRGALHLHWHIRPDASEGVEVINAAQARVLEPGLADDFTSASWAAGEGHVHPRLVWHALYQACQVLNVRFQMNNHVQFIDIKKENNFFQIDGVAGFSAPRLVMATGAWTSQILRASGLAGPDIRPVKGEMVVLQADPDAMPVTRLVWTDDCYIIPQSEGRVLVGATQVEEGFDLTINAVRVDALKRAAAKAIPALGRLSEVERFCGFRPASVDAQPVVGSAGIPGLTLLTGQFRNGILFAPLLAEAAAHHVLTGALPHGMEAFSAMRFIRNAA